MKALLLLGAFAIVASGCAHSAMRGTVAMKVNKKEAHVCLGEGSVTKGDPVVFYKNNCTRVGEESGDSICRLEVLGKGTVSRTLNKHYSVVETDGSFKFKEGTLVEKVSKK